MLLPNEGVELLFKHPTSILKIFHFDFNDPNHFISLSDDGEVIEWYFNHETLQVTEIVKFHLKRPGDDLLIQNKHKIYELKKGEYYKITNVIQFEEFLALGYSDGVILVYQITKKVKNKNIKKKEKKEKKEIKENNKNEKKGDSEKGAKEGGVEVEFVDHEDEEQKESNSVSMSAEDKIESGNNLNLNNTNEENGEENEEENNSNHDNDNSIISVGLDYYNYFSLYYVLLGHTLEIHSLCYIPQTKMIVSSSDDFTVKIYDFNTGHLIYFFKLDFIVNRILYQNIGRNKNDNKIVLTLLSNDPVKVIINLTTNPITFNNYFFKYNEIIQLEQINDKYYLLNDKNVLILDRNLEPENAFISLDNIYFKYFNKFKNDNLIVDNENNIRIVDFIQKKKDNNEKDKKNEKNKKQKNTKANDEDQEEEPKINETIIITECKFKVGEDSINGFYCLDKYIFVYCQDGRLYLVKYDKIKENYERMQMAIEDLASLRMMSSLVFVKKPKKKAKGKKGKDKKK